MTINNLLSILCIIVVITACVILTIYLTLNHILVSYQRKTATMDYSELIGILAMAIRTEIDLYEKDIFANKKAINNSNFDNYYKDLCERILNGLTDTFISQITVYITYETVVSYVARGVKQYLTGKVNGTV